MLRREVLRREWAVIQWIAWEWLFIDARRRREKEEGEGAKLLWNRDVCRWCSIDLDLEAGLRVWSVNSRTKSSVNNRSYYRKFLYHSECVSINSFYAWMRAATDKRLYIIYSPHHRKCTFHFQLMNAWRAVFVSKLDGEREGGRKLSPTLPFCPRRAHCCWHCIVFFDPEFSGILY